MVTEAVLGTTLGSMSVRELRLRLWVKENLKRARLKPVVGEPMTLFEAAMEMKARESYIHKWEDPTRGSPTKKSLGRVVRWIERRLKIDSPEP
jgi:hypothetical protein